MFSENLKTLRKAKGFSQEELAIRLNVARQTISKWEKGLSVPDADMLIRISEILETSVCELLGAKIIDEASVNQVAEQLSRINEQLAIKNCRAKLIWKIILGSIITVIVFYILFAVIGIVSYNSLRYDKRIEVKSEAEIFIPEE